MEEKTLDDEQYCHPDFCLAKFSAHMHSGQYFVSYCATSSFEFEIVMHLSIASLGYPWRPWHGDLTASLSPGVGNLTTRY